MSQVGRILANVLLTIAGIVVIYQLDGIYDAVGVFIMMWAHNLEHHS